ncbi:unnamed protein product [Tenebrio molitor]|jgi:hypothetical protein|nr:unnamed protein product [Tenebrio molitor]
MISTRPTLAQVASILGICQGAVYVVVSAKCILEYILNTPPENLFEYNYNLNYPVCVKFLWEYTDFPSSYILTPNSFTAIMTLSLGFNIVWMRISARIKRYGTNDDSTKLLSNWAIIVFAISGIDLLLFTLIAKDYDQNCNKSVDKNQTELQMIGVRIICSSVMYPMLILTARGFIFWVVNLIFAIVIWTTVRNVNVLGYLPFKRTNKQTFVNV